MGPRYRWNPACDHGGRLRKHRPLHAAAWEADAAAWDQDGLKPGKLDSLPRFLFQAVLRLLRAPLRFCPGLRFYLGSASFRLGP